MLPAAARARILAPYAAPRLWLAQLDLPPPLETYLTKYGQPIRYGYVPRRWPVPPTGTSTQMSLVAPRCRARGRPFTPS